MRGQGRTLCKYHIGWNPPLIDFDSVNFLFLDGDVPRRPSYGVYISQLLLECVVT